VVWMGRDDNAPMRGITGGSAPTAMWRDFMHAALPHLPHGAIPAGPPAPLPPPAPIVNAPEPQTEPPPAAEPAPLTPS